MTFCFVFQEFFAENLGDFFIFLRRFADDVLESSAESLEQILNFITIFMGNVERYRISAHAGFSVHKRHIWNKDVVVDDLTSTSVTG